MDIEARGGIDGDQAVERTPCRGAAAWSGCGGAGGDVGVSRNGHGGGDALCDDTADDLLARSEGGARGRGKEEEVYLALFENSWG